MKNGQKYCECGYLARDSKDLDEHIAQMARLSDEWELAGPVHHGESKNFA